MTDNRWIDYSRRTDVACIAGLERLKSMLAKEGYPAVLCFWTKNPKGIAEIYSDIISEMQHHGTIILAQVTINGYGKVLEPGISDDMFDLSGLVKSIGSDHVRFRFDPIIPGFTTMHHFRRTVAIAEQFGIDRIITNFIVPGYKGVGKLLAKHGIIIPEITDVRRKDILGALSNVLCGSNISLAVCAETAKFADDHIKTASCSDPAWAKQFGSPDFKLNPSRKGCGCCYSADWGRYPSQGGWTCPHGCLYCYAK